MDKMEETKEKRGILVSVCEKGKDKEASDSLDELERLLETAGGTAAARVIQAREKPDAATCVGSGKLSEISELCRSLECELVIFDCELTPAQIRNCEDAMDVEVSVIDRSMLILDIFALHAESSAGRLQVELAQLKYTAPRLRGKGKDMSRLGGGVGTRGPGESRLETDRRHLKERCRALEEELKKTESVRMTQRAARDRSGICKCAVVGYTNAGKSTLLNTLTGAGVLAENKLFATLDPVTRQLDLPGGSTVLLTDTVGFIKKLPHHLVKAFKSTLEEAVFADILLIVADASAPFVAEETALTEKTLNELGAEGKPRLLLFNKWDAADSDTRCALAASAKASGTECCFISALTGEGLDTALAAIERLAQDRKKPVTLNIPFSESGAVNTAYKLLEGVTAEYTDEGVRIFGIASAESAGKLARYIENYDTVFPKIET